MQKKILAMLFGALVIGLITTSSGFSQNIIVSGQVTKSIPAGGSDWSKEVNRFARDYRQLDVTVPFSATGYYSNLTCTLWPSDKGYGVAALAELPGGKIFWYGEKKFTSATTKTVNIVAKRFGRK